MLANRDAAASSRVGGYLHLAGALQSPQIDERLRNAPSAGKQAVIAQNCQTLIPKVVYEPGLLIVLNRDAFEIMISDSVVQ